ncbi:hypothetical protein ACWEU6_14860 [Streptosporangium sandarakinum]|uniref:hypothetical protein n=1 Tax=Streptosporangium sandarakinum TaxID=1260955 RepID=UPI0036A146E4
MDLLLDSSTGAGNVPAPDPEEIMLSTSVVRPLAPPPARRRARRGHRWPWWLLAAGFAAQVGLRLWLFRYHTGPVANPDETGYLAAARWLAGGPGADFSGSTFYQGGYPLLLVPAFWLTSDPTQVYRLVVGIGSITAAGAFPLAYMLVRRWGLERKAALAMAFAAGLSPALLLFSGLALADAILPTLVLGLLVALYDLAERGSLPAGAAAGGLAAFAMAVHLRGTVILAVSVLIVVALLVSGRVPRRAGFAALGVAAAVAAVGTLLNGALSAELYPGGPRDLAGLLVTRLTSLEGQAWALSGAAGQLWYLIVGTWGLAGVGFGGVAVLLARRGVPLARRVSAATLALVTLGVAYASSAALPDEHRVGNYAYGRYTACVAVAWTLIGIVTLVRARRLTVPRHALAAAALMAGTGGVAAWYAGDRLGRYAFIAFDFPEVIFLSGVRDSLDMTAASATALAMLAVLAAAALLPRRRGRLPVVAAVLAAINIAFVVHLAPAPASAAGGDPFPVPAAGRVAVDLRVRWHVWVPLVHRVWWTELERFDGARRLPPAGACTVIAPPTALPPAGWTVTGEGGARQGWTAWTGSGSGCA